MHSFTLTRAVGKGIHGANPVDVKTIQSLLSVNKDRGRPYYAGKLDSKVGPKTIAAITAFQTKERLPVTGCVKPGDPTVQRLKIRTPSTAKAQVQQATATASLNSAQGKSKLQQITRITCQDIMKAPLPAKEAKALADQVQKLGQQGVPVKLGPVDLTQDGRFKVTLTSDPIDPRSGTARQSVCDAQAATITQAFKTNPTWKPTSDRSLSVETAKQSLGLKRGDCASPAFLKALGLTSPPQCTVTSAVLAAIESQLERSLTHAS